LVQLNLKPARSYASSLLMMASHAATMRKVAPNESYRFGSFHFHDFQPPDAHTKLEYDDVGAFFMQVSG
jgi:hypothetical protein